MGLTAPGDGWFLSPPTIATRICDSMPPDYGSIATLMPWPCCTCSPNAALVYANNAAAGAYVALDTAMAAAAAAQVRPARRGHAAPSLCVVGQSRLAGGGERAASARSHC
eukprot:5099617-Pleurochrysis_carterae.AAC.2